jgi:hypothetical protein
LERAPIGCNRGLRANISSVVQVMKEPGCSHDAEGGEFQLADVRSLSGPALLVMLPVLACGAAFAVVVGVEELAHNLIRTAGRLDSLRPRHKLAAWDDDFLVSLVAR